MALRRVLGTKSIPPAVAVVACVARAAADVHPKFLETLRTTVRDFRISQMGATAETLRIFEDVLDDPEIFSKG
ncbi:MAG: hypothetical protein K8F62_04380 [Pseudorhodoplanes sp.]|nr:hypothetical protein [Pseudorhodoplanes sp.]